LTLTGHGPADTIAGLLRGDPGSASARVAQAEGLVTRLDALSPDEERLNAVIAAAPVAVLEVDLDTRVVRWNAAAERIYGWRAEEVLGERVPLVPPDREAEFQWLLGRVRAGNAYTGFETVRRRKDGSQVDVEIAAAPVRDGTGEIVSHMVVFTDISERKQAERELRLSRAQVVEAGDAERRRLERNLHDGAQQRLVALSLELGLLKQRFQDDGEAQRAIDQARRELGESLQELRDLARGIHPVIVTGHGLAAAAESLAARSPVRVELDLEIGERPPEVVEVAAYYLLAEALTNVAKYAHASCATVEIKRSNGSLIVEVADDGVGGADAAAGSGLLGLTDRIEALGGSLRVWSPEGGGTRVHAELPCE
jgi:PAS domain S-box-containing protein